VHSVSPARPLHMPPPVRKRTSGQGALSLSLSGSERKTLESTGLILTATRSSKSVLDDLRIFVSEHGAGGTACDGLQNDVCVPCRLMNSVAMNSRKGCIRKNSCYVCLGADHSKSSCTISTTVRLSLGAVCWSCALPGADTGGHVNLVGKKVPFSVPCGSYAQDVLLPTCWVVFRDKVAMSNPSNPARGIRGQQTFYDWLFGFTNNTSITNSVTLAHWALTVYYRQVVSFAEQPAT